MKTTTTPYDLRPTDAPVGWTAACDGLAVARRTLRLAPLGIARQAAYTQLVMARDLVVEVMESWMAAAVGAAPVQHPERIVVLGDRVLFDEGTELASVSLAAAIALRALQLAGVGVVLATGASAPKVQSVVQRFALMAGVAEYGGPATPTSERSEGERRAEEQLSSLRTALRADTQLVLAPNRLHSVRACRVVEGRAVPIGGPEGRELLERLRLTDVALRVTPLHTDFFASDATRATRQSSALGCVVPPGVPLVVVAGSAADEWTLKAVPLVFAPLGVLRAHRPERGQRLTRMGRLPSEVLWFAVWHLLPSTQLRQQAAEMLASVQCPDWIPEPLCRRPAPAEPRWLQIGRLDPTPVSSPVPMSVKVR